MCRVVSAPSPPLSLWQENQSLPAHTTPAPARPPLRGYAAGVLSRTCLPTGGILRLCVYSYAVEKPLSVGHKVAGYLPSLFWGFITLGRLISIPISSRVKPATMVFVNVVSGLLSLFGDPEEPFTPGPSTAPGHLFGTGLCQQVRNVEVEGGEERRRGERCWWGRDGNPRGGAYSCDLGKVLCPL